MEQEFNIGDLWQWARGGEMTPFTVYRDGQPVCRVIRVNGDNMDWLYAQYGQDDGMFTLPFEPFGMWTWPERMCCIREEYAGLGNWNLHEAEERARQAYHEAAVTAVNEEANALQDATFTRDELQAAEQLAGRLAENGLGADGWAESGMVELGEPVIYPGPLFLDEGKEVYELQQEANGENPAVQSAARLVAAMRQIAAETPPEPEEAPSEETQESQPSGKGEAARKNIVAALKGQRVMKVIVKIKGKGKKHNYPMRRLDLIEDLEKHGAVQPEHLGGEVKSPVTAKAIEKITKLNGKDVLYSKE